MQVGGIDLVIIVIMNIVKLDLHRHNNEPQKFIRLNHMMSLQLQLRGR